MARPKFATSIDMKGPFFTKDPAKTFRSNARSMMRAIAIEGQTDVIAQLITGNASRAPISALGDHVSAHVSAGVPFTPAKAKAGAIIANVYVPNYGYSVREGKSLMAAFSRVEKQTHAFRRTTGRLRRAKKLNAAELLKGLT